MINELLPQVIEITREAGAEVMKYYQGAFEVQEKKPDNPVTEADFAADKLLHDRLLALLPEAGWLSEETVDNPDRLSKKYLWVVDPLDGTKEFVMGIPEFSISVALVEDGFPVIGVIYNPPANELYTAAKGSGLMFNGKPCTVSDRSELQGAIVDASRSERKRGEFEPFEEMFEIRTMGSIAYKLARTAAGQADATWSRGPKHEWDICAGVLLIKEGGGECVDLDGAEFLFNKSWPKVNGIIADNRVLHNEVMATLAPHRDTARTDKK